MTQDRYIFQQQNSVTKRWANVAEGTLDEMETRFNAAVASPDNERYQHKYRVVELSQICCN